jgi:hypothetical protein
MTGEVPKVGQGFGVGDGPHGEFVVLGQGDREGEMGCLGTVYDLGVEWAKVMVVVDRL